MSADRVQHARGIKKSALGYQPHGMGTTTSGPTSFFLCTERDLNRHSSAGSQLSSSCEDSLDNICPTANEKDDLGMRRDVNVLATSASCNRSAFGVQSLEDLVTLSQDRTSGAAAQNVYNNSFCSSDRSEQRTIAEMADSPTRHRRRAGNPVHPKIIAAGQRILSSEHQALEQSASATSEETSPYRRIRRTSYTNLTGSSQPVTPPRLSPRPSSLAPSSSRSLSPRSLRLSDEETSVIGELNNQTVDATDSNKMQELGVVVGEGGNGASMPQLVMPSLAMPARRPFTDRGRLIGRLKIMLVGAQGVGKTGLIRSICRSCHDIVHVDHLDDAATDSIHEFGASTRQYPAWWTEVGTNGEENQQASIGEGVLERNLTMIDTPGLGLPHNVDCVEHFFNITLDRACNLSYMTNNEIVSMLTGAGSNQIDATLYLVDAACVDPEKLEMNTWMNSDLSLLRHLCQWTTVIPVITRADTVAQDSLPLRKKYLVETFEKLNLDMHYFTLMQREIQDQVCASPQIYATSSILGDDSETIDASLLMSSNYLPPLYPSELEDFIDAFLDADHLTRLRHMSAVKQTKWLRQKYGQPLIEHSRSDMYQLSENANDENVSLHTSTESLLKDESKVMVPHASSMFFRSSSTDALSLSSIPLSSLSENVNPASNDPGFRQLRLATWAHDLQRSLLLERERYKAWYSQPATSLPSSPLALAPQLSLPEDDDNADLGLPTALSLLKRSVSSSDRPRPSRGRLGGALSIIDPRDPLGLLAMQRQGWLVLRLVGAGAALIWVVQSFWSGTWQSVHTFPAWSWNGSGRADLLPINIIGMAPSTTHPFLPDLHSWISAEAFEHLITRIREAWSGLFGHNI